MLIVGLTGGMGSGKSTVAGMLAERGAVVIDADAVARQVAQPGGAAYRPLVDHFGSGIVLPDGTLDRSAIAARAFADATQLAMLNRITHPAIAAAMAGQIAEHAGGGRVMVLDLPLLGEDTRSRYSLAGVIVVDTPVEVAVGRLVEQRNLNETDVRARIAAQPGRDERRRLADVVIDNGRSRQDLARSVDDVWSWITGLQRQHYQA